MPTLRLLADLPEGALSLIERYGSFGLVCVIVIALIVGIFAALRFVKTDVWPKLMAYLEQKDAAHAAEREKKDAEHRAERAEADAANREALGRLTAAVEKQGAQLDGHGRRLDRIEDRIDDARARPHPGS